MTDGFNKYSEVDRTVRAELALRGANRGTTGTVVYDKTGTEAPTTYKMQNQTVA